MQTAVQFSVFLVNKPGVLAQVTHSIAEAKVNIVALTMMDSMEHGVLRLVATDEEKAREALGRLNIPTTETEVLIVPISNRTGALADVCGLLAKSHINITYAYSTTGARGGRTTAIFKVADLKKAMKVLAKFDPKPQKKKRLPKTRPSPGQSR